MLERYQHRIAVDVDTRTVTVADYSVCIQGLPRNTTHSELFAFFSEWGEVHSIELVRTDCELIERARIEKRCSENVKVAVARAARYAAKVEYHKINQNHKILEIRWKYYDMALAETQNSRNAKRTRRCLYAKSPSRTKSCKSGLCVCNDARSFETDRTSLCVSHKLRKTTFHSSTSTFSWKISHKGKLCQPRRKAGFVFRRFQRQSLQISFGRISNSVPSIASSEEQQRQL